MSKKVSRTQLLAQSVSGADDFTALRYLRLREETPRLPELEETGAASLPNVQGAMLDLYHSLWSPEPSVKSVEEIPTALGYWRQMLDEAVKTTAFEQMHAQTQLQELASLVGTISMGTSILEMVPKEDREKLQEQAEAYADAQNAKQQLQEAQAEADAAGELLAQLQQAVGKSKPSKKARESMDQAQSQMQSAQEQAQAAQVTLEEAKAKAETLATELLGKPGSKEAGDKQTQMARIAQAVATKAATEVKEVSDLLESWGVDAGELTRQSMPKALDIVARMRKSEEFKKFKELLGRMRHIVARKAASNARSEGRVVSKVEYGRDITRAEGNELASLVHPATRTKTLQRWVRTELRLVGRQRKQKLGKGPVVVCEDGSSSMEGEKKLWSKAVCLALAYYARLEKRTYVWIHFGSKNSRMVARIYPNGQISAEQMLEIAETFLSSGTDFEDPLSKGLEVIKTESLKRADIALITDGECAVTDAWLADFLATKKALEVNVITVLMDVGSSSNATVNQFSDRVETVSQFTAEEAGQKVISNLV